METMEVFVDQSPLLVEVDQRTVNANMIHLCDIELSVLETHKTDPTCQHEEVYTRSDNNHLNLMLA